VSVAITPQPKPEPSWRKFLWRSELVAMLAASLWVVVLLLLR
jgi:hypothetical protein